MLQLLLMLASFLITSPSISECSMDDYVGSWTGTIMCDGSAAPTTNITISKMDDTSKMQVTYGNGDVVAFNVMDCKLTHNLVDEAEGIEVFITYSLVNGVFTESQDMKIKSGDQVIEMACSGDLMKK